MSSRRVLRYRRILFPGFPRVAGKGWSARTRDTDRGQNPADGLKSTLLL